MKLTSQQRSDTASRLTFTEDDLWSRLHSTLTAVRYLCLAHRSASSKADELARTNSVIAFLLEVAEEIPQSGPGETAKGSKLTSRDTLEVWAFELELICDAVAFSEINDEADTLVRISAGLCRMLRGVLESGELNGETAKRFSDLCSEVSCDSLFQFSQPSPALADAA